MVVCMFYEWSELLFPQTLFESHKYLMVRIGSDHVDFLLSKPYSVSQLSKFELRILNMCNPGELHRPLDSIELMITNINVHKSMFMKRPTRSSR